MDKFFKKHLTNFRITIIIYSVIYSRREDEVYGKI